MIRFWMSKKEEEGGVRHRDMREKPVREALNLDKMSLLRIGVRHLSSIRKEWLGVSDKVQFRGGVVKGLDIRPSTPTMET